MQPDTVPENLRGSAIRSSAPTPAEDNRHVGGLGGGGLLPHIPMDRCHLVSRLLDNLPFTVDNNVIFLNYLKF